MMKSIREKYFSGLTRDTFLLTLTSLFADISTEMLYPVLPVFLTQNLKAGGSIVGLVEGIAQATQNIAQGFFGWLSDKLQKRKSMALIGYTFAACSKPLIGLAGSWHGVLGGRFLDRFGSGMRSAPRDGLVAGSADEGHRGKAFGLEGIGDNMGAFLGPIVAVFLLYTFHVPIRSIFYLAFIPGMIAVSLIFFIKEKKVDFASKASLDVTSKIKLPTSYWKYISAIGLFGIGNVGNSFLILQTKSIGVSLEITILIYAFYNLVAALISYPSGYLSDMFGRKKILLFSFIIFLLTFLSFAFTQNKIMIAVLFILYGLYQGIFRSVGKAYASDFVPQERRASSIGWYSATVGLSGLAANLIAGQLWDRFGHPSVFIYGSIVGAIAIIYLLFFVTENRHSITS